MNQLSSWQSFRSLRAQRSNPDLPSLRGAERRSNLLAYTLVILCFVFAPVQARTLNLAKQKIKDISKLKVKEGVTKLKLQKNKITSIAPLKLPSTLKTLNLSFNKITDLSELQLNSNLDSLVAYGNEITTIDGLNLPEGLRYLTLSNNENLNDIYTLQLSPSLEELRLLFCNISDSEMNGLVLNANLDTLNLAFNNLTTLDGIQFNDTIADLSLNRNKFTEMNWSSLPQNLKILDFSSNRDVTNYDEMVLPPTLLAFDLAVLFFDNPSFMNGKLPDTLTLLELQRNFITSLDGFEFPPNLEELDLEHNSLNDFDYELPESMRLLNLRKNLISKRTRREIRARYRDMPNLKIKF